uniref:Uncharacterized protein n=1 Tax=Oryza glumipatula TaxID=40148 RepID=A0A0D9YVX7_9ORYZ
MVAAGGVGDDRAPELVRCARAAAAQPKPPQIVKCPQILPPPRLATSNRNPGIRLGVGAFPLRLAGGGIGTVVWAHWEGWLGFVSWRALMILTRSGSAPALLHRRRLAGCGGSHQSVRASPALRRKEDLYGRCHSETG